MAQRAINEGATQWYLIARGRHGEAVIRVRPGMSLGETPAGELSFDPHRAHVELDIADDGGLVLSALDAHELKSARGIYGQHERLTLDGRVEIRLPHNALHLVTDFLDRGRANDTVEVLAAEPAGDSAGPRVSRVPEAVQDKLANASARRGASTDASTHAATVATPRPRRPTRDEHAVAAVVSTWRAERNGAGRQRVLRSMLARPRFDVLLIGLAIIGLALLYPGIRESNAPQPSATVGAGTASDTSPARAPAAAGTPRAAKESPSAVFPPKPLVLSTKEALRLTEEALRPIPRASPPAEPAGDAREELLAAEASAGNRSAEHAASGTPSDELGTSWPAARASAPQVAQSVDSTEVIAAPEANDDRPEAAVEVKPDAGREAIGLTATETVASEPPERRSAPQAAPSVVATHPVEAPATIDREPVTTIAARPKEDVQTTIAARPTQRIETPKASTEELVLHALSSADLALAQERLTTPPGTSAFALYNRVLALDPESQEARRGLQAVRQGLINRALAQLAGGALDEARSSLQTAEEAGADPMLVANLRNEVDYRQRTMNP